MSSFLISFNKIIIKCVEIAHSKGKSEVYLKFIKKGDRTAQKKKYFCNGDIKSKILFRRECALSNCQSADNYE